MPDIDPIILLTRPAKQAGEFREFLGTDVDVIESPVFKIQFFERQLNLQNYSAVIFTSRNAVDAVASQSFRTGPVTFAVGDKTAEAARSLGLETFSANGNADKLVKKILLNAPGGRLLLIRGKHTTGNIEERLNLAGLETDFVIVYDQVAMGLSPNAVLTLQGDRPVLIPLFSARSAAILSDAVNEAGARAPLILAAISAVALNAWHGPAPVDRGVASAPTADAMVAEILRRIRRTP